MGGLLSKTPAHGENDEKLKLNVEEEEDELILDIDEKLKKLKLNVEEEEDELILDIDEKLKKLKLNVEEEEDELILDIEEHPIHASVRDSFRAIEGELKLRTTLLGTTSKVAFIGRKISLARSSIHAEVREHLAEFSSIREARRDIDCFYRCYAFSYLEHILKRPHILEKKNRRMFEYLLGLAGGYRYSNRRVGGSTTTFLDFFEEFSNLFSRYSKAKKDIARYRRELLLKFQDAQSPMKIILFLRMIIAIEIHINRAMLSDYKVIENIEEFCLGEVFPVSGTHMHAEILSKRLGVPVRVVDLALAEPAPNISVRHGNDNAAATSSGSKTSTSTAVKVTRPFVNFEITLLYRPGRSYDILYPDGVTCCGLGEFLL